MHVLNALLSHWVSNEIWAPTTAKLCLMLKKSLIMLQNHKLHQFGTQPPRFSPILCLEWTWQNPGTPFLEKPKNPSESLYALCSRGKLFRLQGSAQGPLSPDSRSLEEILPSEALLFSARHRQQKVLRPILQGKRNMKVLTAKTAVNTLVPWNQNTSYIYYTWYLALV